MDVQRSVEIKAPRERVWPLLIDPVKVKQWYVTLEDFRYVDERRGPGAHVRVVERAPGSQLKAEFEATSWVENETLALHMTSGSGAKAYDQRWDLAATDAGCRFTFAEHVELPFGPVGRLLGLVAKRSSEGHVREMLAKLKDLAEA